MNQAISRPSSIMMKGASDTRAGTVSMPSSTSLLTFTASCQNSLIPSGQDASATGNWSHTYNAQATGLLNQWKVTLDPKKQQAIATQLENIFLDQMPIVPLFIGPRWSTYSTKYFHCFNSPKNFYGDPIFSTYPDNLLSFTRICPGGKAGA